MYVWSPQLPVHLLNSDSTRPQPLWHQATAWGNIIPKQPAAGQQEQAAAQQKPSRGASCAMSDASPCQAMETGGCSGCFGARAAEEVLPKIR